MGFIAAFLARRKLRQEKGTVCQPHCRLSELERYPFWDNVRLEALAGKIGFTGVEAEEARAEVLRIIQSCKPFVSEYATLAHAETAARVAVSAQLAADVSSAEAACVCATAAHRHAKAEHALSEARFVEALLSAEASVLSIRSAVGVYRVGIAFADATRAVHSLVLAQSALGLANATLAAAEEVLAASKASVDDARAASARDHGKSAHAEVKRSSFWLRMLSVRQRIKN